MKRLFLLAFAIALAPTPAHAQLETLRAAEAPVVGLELAKGFFEADGLSWYTSTLRARGLFPVSPTAAVFADWGVSLAGVDGSGTDGTFANPEVGLARIDDEGRVTAYLSAVVPLAFGFGEDDASVFTGFLTDPFRIDRFFDELWSLNAGFAPSARLGERTDLTSEIVASYVVPTEDDSDSEFFARYAVGVRHEAESIAVRGGIEGWAVISESGISLGDRTVHRILLAVDGANGGPGFFARIPIDDTLEDIDAVLGVTFAF